MRQRLALGGVGAAVVLGFLLVWGGALSKPVSAMDRMAEKIRQAKSCRATWTLQSTEVLEPGQPPVTVRAYPRISMVRTQWVCDEMHKMIDIVGEPAPEQALGEKLRKVEQARSGFSCLAQILVHNPDAAYHAKTVGPDERDHVLVRWQLDDGRYQVIYGDVRSEIVAAERLRARDGT